MQRYTGTYLRLRSTSSPRCKGEKKEKERRRNRPQKRHDPRRSVDEPRKIVVAFIGPNITWSFSPRFLLIKRAVSKSSLESNLSNYLIPITEVTKAVERIQRGNPQVFDVPSSATSFLYLFSLSLSQVVGTHSLLCGR